MFESSKIEISKKAYVNNIKFIQKNLKHNKRLCAVVKGNAYGHGLIEFVTMAMDCGVDYFGVHSVDEAFTLVNNLEVLPDIFIMGYVENKGLEWAIEQGLEIAVFDKERLEKVLEFSQAKQTQAKIHIEIETGMQRTGFEYSTLPFLINFLKENSSLIKFQGLFTHYAGAESQANHFRVKEQMKTFSLCLESFKSENLHPKYYHTSCSAAMINYPDSPGNMVRIGILQYGFWPNKETHIRYCGLQNRNYNIVKRLIRWTSEIMSIKSIKKGNFIGYGTTYLAHKNIIIAVVPIGYSHGYNRSLSNIGKVLVNGKMAPVIAVVNMNSLTVDITNIKHVKKGDEVVLIGKQNGSEITVSSFSEQSNQLNYEMLTRLPANIPRIIID